MTQSIAGQPAPELAVLYWIDAEGKERPPLTLKELGARHRLLLFYQHWCGGCHSHGFPTLQALVQDPRSEDVGVAAVQTAFEGTYVNTRDKLPLDQRRYGLRIPFGHERRSSIGVHPSTMENYCTDGTRGSLPSTLTEWSFRTDSPSTSIGLSKRSLKTA